ncbi:type I pullulanase [Orenia marismortui]|uniref:Pullulanase n=1 Tax=Orenia marismortui TaxID=46469 RepID=A0A4R8HGC5_9FIRM|nr:type I pullulanase [Orenia marismortui]TDX59296.1 pullulanase [Orenia marismortui]
MAQFKYLSDIKVKELQGTQNRLGACYSPKETKFSVWSPNSKRVDLVLYKEAFDLQEADNIYEMNKGDNGIWTLVLSGDHKNKFYHYRVERGEEIYYAVDPYARSVSQNGLKGAIIDLEETNPKGWKNDKRPSLKTPENSIIYEMHVRDFSIYPNSGMKYKGKYLAFTEEGTTLAGSKIRTGIDHLKELGITHLHLLPVFDYGSVDESKGEEYNWGYDPMNYNAPEGSYSTDSTDPLSRVREFKEMVLALHRNGIRVVMDVVYNHTYRTLTSSFGKLAPKSYYRLKEGGEFSNGSGCGNEVASENPMVRKFIVDSVKYWAEEYHIDGFRFDLMALHDKDTMKLIEQTLHKIDPNILIYGEPWMADYSPLAEEEQMRKGEQKNLRIGVFNDNLRDAIKGSTRGEDRGYATGKISNIDYVKEGIVAAVNSFAANPEEVINYVSAHDDLALWDKIEKSNPVDSNESKIKMNNFCNAIVLTSQGIPFLHGGVEILRTKYGVENSYNAPDRINQIEWEKKAENLESFLYYKGLIKLRKEHPAFRMNNSKDIKEHLEFIDTSDGIIMYRLIDHANGDDWEEILVILNPNHEFKTVDLPGKEEWKVVVKDQKAGVEVLEIINSSEVLVPGISAMVLYK